MPLLQDLILQYLILQDYNYYKTFQPKCNHWKFNKQLTFHVAVYFLWE